MKRIAFGFLLVISALLISRELFDGSHLAALNGVAEAQSKIIQIMTEPELPRVYLDTTYPVSTGAVINVAAGGDLQAALNQAQPGDQVVIEAGAVFTGNFILPAKSGDDWIIIRTSNLSALPAEGTRAEATHAAAMPKIVTANTMPALKTATAAHHYRFVGLEVGIAPNATINYGILALGDSGSAQSSLSQVPHDLVIDRCYIHGNPAGDVSRGVALNSAATSVIDSTITNCHGVGFDTQAIGGWNGPGPFKIVNNQLEGAAENFMLGGSDPSIPNLISSDIEFRRNYCTKPLSWCMTEPTYAGVRWSVKNIFELKNAQRVLVDGNVFENCWVDGQTGIAIQLTPRNQYGTSPWATVADVTFTNNIVRHAAAGLNILGSDNNFPSQRTQRIKIKNNLFDDIGGSRWGGNGRLFQIIAGPAYVQIDHNTAFQTYNIVSTDSDPATTGFVFTNNLMPHNEYGVFGSGYGIGNTTLSHYFPGCVFARNVLVGGPGAAYPANNFFPSLMALVGFIDLADGNYGLLPISPFFHAGTDGADIGADFGAMQAAMGGLPPNTNLPPTVSITATPVSGTAPLQVDFASDASDPDGTIVGYIWNFGDGQFATGSAPSHLYTSAGSYTARLIVTDNGGAIASSAVTISITAPPLSSENTVLYASEAPVRVGNWRVVSDQTAAGGACISNPDRSVSKVANASANPADYFEMTFDAQAGTAYHLWVRGRAQNDSPYNDSVHVQFSDSIDASGAAVFRVGTTDSTVINLEDYLNIGVQGWGWQDNGWGINVMGQNLYFATSGTHTLRVQVREDGMDIDQIVLSPTTYLNSSPGALKNDTLILPKSAMALSVSPPTPGSGTATGGMTVMFNGTGFMSGATVRFGGASASVEVLNDTSLRVVTPAHPAGCVDIVVTNPDSASATLLAGYTYLPGNRPPQVSPTASATSGVGSLAVTFAANASDPDGDALTVTWDFGDGQTATGANVAHTYTDPGQYTAVVRATDPAGAFASATLTITVAATARPVVQVFTPLANQKAVVNQLTTITWRVDGGNVESQAIQLSIDGGLTWSDVAIDLPATAQSYSWRVPNLQTRKARIRVIAYGRDGVNGEDLNPGNFFIVTKAK
ncbi:MAG: PKD domain-containing protein [Blastocatellia bacterium]